MHALQCVTFSRTIDFWADMFDLFRAKNLQSLTLANWEPATDDSFEILIFGALMYKMGAERPDVKPSVVSSMAGSCLQTDLLAG